MRHRGDRVGASKTPHGRGFCPRRRQCPGARREFATLCRPPEQSCQTKLPETGMTKAKTAALSKTKTTRAIPVAAQASVLRQLSTLRSASTAELKQRWRE